MSFDLPRCTAVKPCSKSTTSTLAPRSKMHRAHSTRPCWAARKRAVQPASVAAPSATRVPGHARQLIASLLPFGLKARGAVGSGASTSTNASVSLQLKHALLLAP